MRPEQKLFFIAYRIYQNGQNPTGWVIRDEMGCTIRFADYWLDEWRKQHPDPEIRNQVRLRPRKIPQSWEANISGVLVI